MRRLLTIGFLLMTMLAHSQVQLTVEGVDTVLHNVVGYDIPRKVPTRLIFRKNHLEKMTPEGFVLRCGDDLPMGRNHHLDGAVIRGNRLGAVTGGGTHGMMLGFSVDYDVKHNYVWGADYGLVIEGDTGMVYRSGGVAYNIIASNRTFAILLFGPDRVKIYNNTFFSNRQRSSNGILRIETNNQHGYDIHTRGTEVKNNIFYSERDPLMIAFDAESLKTLECDYNLYYCEAGYPVFRNSSEGINYNWYQWRAMGYDTHSVVVNPRFIDKEGFVPRARLDFGTDLGEDYSHGLATTARWVAGSYPDTLRQQGDWQVGAILLDAAEPPEQSVTAPEMP